MYNNIYIISTIFSETMFITDWIFKTILHVC